MPTATRRRGSCSRMRARLAWLTSATVNVNGSITVRPIVTVLYQARARQVDR